MYRKAFLVAVAAVLALLLFSETASADIVVFIFEGTATEFTGSPDNQGDPFDVTLEIAIDIEQLYYNEWETSGILIQEAWGNGTFQWATGTTSDGDTWSLLWEDVLTQYDSTYNYASGYGQARTYPDASVDWELMANVTVAGESSADNAWLEGWLEIGAYGSSLDDPIPVTAHFEQGFYPMGAPAELYGYDFNGVFTGYGVVPEPATLTLLGLGLCGLAVRRLRK